MNYRIVVIAALAMASISAMVFSQEFTGEWVADVDPITKKTAKTIYEFNVDGSKLTGSILRSYAEEEIPIVNGKVKGDKISFTLQVPRGNRTIPFLYKGKISGNAINFDVTYGAHTELKFAARRSNQ